MRDYNLSLMPKRHTVARFTSVKMGSGLALKRLMTGFQSIIFIGLLWLFTLIIFSYWYRLFEFTACALRHTKHNICHDDAAIYWIIHGNTFRKVNDLYFQNSIWFNFVTSTTVGYGEQVPSPKLQALNPKP